MSSASVLINRDHPRIRGEHFNGPRFRGYLMGIIPAYAGSTYNGAITKIDAQGSSPHTRGAPAARLPQ